jgi:hypothetical protein
MADDQTTALLLQMADDLDRPHDSDVSIRYRNAVAAVLNLHRPEPIDGDEPNGPQYCSSCIGSDEEYMNHPCRTVQAITAALLNVKAGA